MTVDEGAGKMSLILIVTENVVIFRILLDGIWDNDFLLHKLSREELKFHIYNP